MNARSNTTPQRGDAYATAQSALQPVSEALQVDVSISSLDNSVEFLVETVQALLRRIEPVTAVAISGIGTLTGTFTGSVNCSSGIIGAATFTKAPLAMQIDVQYDRIAALTKEVQTAIRALQI
jgi:hypothetical protein